MSRARQPLTEEVHSGDGEGRPVDVTNLESGVVVRLLGLLKWNSAGDVAARLALLDRDVSRYEMRSGEGLAANMKVGIVVRQFDEIALKTRFGGEHFAVTDWNVVKNVVHDIRGAQCSRSMSMEIGAFGQKWLGRQRQAHREFEKIDPLKCSDCGRVWSRPERLETSRRRVQQMTSETGGNCTKAAKQQSISILPRVGHVAEQDTWADIDLVFNGNTPAHECGRTSSGSSSSRRLHNDLADNQF